jgi:asparagine synthase (glutamine-hydrolysing)
VPEPETIYEDIRALPRSHYLVVDSFGQHLRKYSSHFDDSALEVTDDTVLEETRRVVTAAIKSRLLSDVPIGCFLSGGLDSSIVAKTISRHRGPDFNTYTVGFENIDDPHHGSADEAVLAEPFAGSLGSRHRTVRVTSQLFRENLQRFAYHGGQPFCISSGLGILAISEAARQDGVKVLLSGDCADENFGGYSWYPHLEDLPTGSFDQQPSLSFSSYGLPLERRLRAISSYPSAKRAWAWHYFASEEEKASIFSRDMREGALSSLRILETYRRGEWEPLD